MSRASRWLPWAFAVGAAACGKAGKVVPPLGQLDVYLVTDAPLPPAPGEVLSPGDPLPLFDRARIEVYEPGVTSPCDECTHEFDLDRTLVGQGTASVGLAPPVGASGYVIRVRMFQSQLGQPRPEATVDVFAALPPTDTEGITAITVMLSTDDVAHPVGSLASPVQPDAGPAPTGLAGTWPGGVTTPCSGPPGAHQVCIPGGAYWMGNPRVNLVPDNDSLGIRLAVVSPFYLDETEVTVGALRRSGVAVALDPLTVGNGYPDCTFNPYDPNADGLPVNCLTWDRARQYCQKLGGDLPTEAQFQYAASGLRGATYVWGEDPPSCSDAVYARSPLAFSQDSRCPGSGAEPPGQGVRDRLMLPDGVLVDLAGNLAEFARDFFQRTDESCWAAVGVAQDPTCDASSRYSDAKGLHTVMAGGWLLGAGNLAAASRYPGPPLTTVGLDPLNDGDSLTGFRCARKGS